MGLHEVFAGHPLSPVRRAFLLDPPVRRMLVCTFVEGTTGYLVVLGSM